MQTAHLMSAMGSEKAASYKPGGHSMQAVLLALGGRIRSERQRKGVSQEGLAKDCGLHRTALGLLERGKSIPRLDTLLLVSRHLGLTVSELLRGIEVMSAKRLNELARDLRFKNGRVESTNQSACPPGLVPGTGRVRQ